MATTQIRSKQQFLITDHVPANNFRITGAADGVSPQDLVTLAQLQSYSAGQNTKPSVRAATTGAESYTITGGAVTQIAGTTVDGVALAINDRLIIKNAPVATGAGAGAGTAETNQIPNGIYIVTGNTTNLTVARATDMDVWSEVPSAYCWVDEGTSFADTGWIVTTNRGTALSINGAGATILWVLYASASALIAGAGLNKTGNTIDVVSTTLNVTANAVDLATVTQTNGAGTDGISFVQSHSVDSFGRITGTITANVRVATTSVTGIASFNAASFAVTAGDVTIKAGGVTNTQLVNSSITLGATAVALGAATGTSGTPITNLFLTTPSFLSVVNGANTITLPTFTSTLATLAGTETLTNKSMSGTNNTFTNLPNSALTNSSVTVTAGTGLSGGGAVALGGSVTLSNAGVLSITGTANQITASAATGAITLSLPQNIHTGATPTFAGLIINAGTDTVGVTNTTVTETWNNAGVSFLSNLINVTDTASAAASRFVEYQVAGVPKYSLRKDGTITTGIWGGTVVTSAFGGTGFGTYTQGDILWASAANTLSKLGISATVGNSLMVTATGTLGYAATNLAGGAGYITGVLSPANGGTGTSTVPTAGQVLVGVTGGTYTPATIASGTGITVTAGSGTISIAVSAAVLQATNYVPYEVPAQTPNGSVTDFTIANTPATGAAGASTLHVYLNGVRLQPASNDYAMFNATTVRFQAGMIPQANDVVSFTYFK
jgi:hypothetical protein